MNMDLNNYARNTNDVEKIKMLVKLGADLLSTNGDPWYHTPLHQACFHGRLEVVKVLIDLLYQQGLLEKNLKMESNPCGRGTRGYPMELAQGGNHKVIVGVLALCEQDQDHFEDMQSLVTTSEDDSTGSFLELQERFESV